MAAAAAKRIHDPYTYAQALITHYTYAGQEAMGTLPATLDDLRHNSLLCFVEAHLQAVEVTDLATAIDEAELLLGRCLHRSEIEWLRHGLVP